MFRVFDSAAHPPVMYPPNLSDPDFLRRSQNYWFYGIILSCMCYGLNLALALSSTRLLLPQLRSSSKNDGPLGILHSNSDSANLYSLGSVFLLLGFATASMIPVVIVGKGAFSGTMDSSGGPAQYLVKHVFQNVTTLRVAYVASILCHICISLRLIKTCFIIQKHAMRTFCRRGVLWHGTVMSIPLTLFCASTVSGIIFVIQVLSPSRLSHYLASKNWVLIWGATATALLWELISMISACLLVYRRSLLRSLGEHLQIRYMGIISMLLECALLLSSFGIFFMVAYSVNSPSLVMVPFLLSQVQVTSPLLVLYRVTSNRTLSKNPTFVGPSMPSFVRRSTASEDVVVPQQATEPELCGPQLETTVSIPS